MRFRKEEPTFRRKITTAPPRLPSGSPGLKLSASHREFF